MIRAAELIERKRDGEELSAEEISELVLGYARGDVPDYQMAAWCMAVYFRGLTGRETHALTDAMIRSGETLDLGAALGRQGGRQALDRRRRGQDVDRGRPDRRRLRRAVREDVRPRASATRAGRSTSSSRSRASGRALDVDEFVAQVRDVGLAIVGQTDDLVPADKQLYALRDVTATVDIVPLIASSIMSKKIAAGADAIVLDVKVGDGAFMKTLDDARILAEQMLDLGRRASREVVCLLTDMDQPLGAAVGNALEIREALATLCGEGRRTSRSSCSTLARASWRSPISAWTSTRAAARRAGGGGRLGARAVRALDPCAGRRPRSRRAAARAGVHRGRGVLEAAS